MAIFQEKNKQKITKDGRCWLYRCYYTDIYGNRKQKESKLYKTKKEAQDAERDFLNKTSTKDIANTEIKFSQAYEEWIKFKSKAVKISTIYGIKKVCNKHIYDYFKSYKVSFIKFNIINKWLDYIESFDFTIDYKNIIIGHFKEILLYFVDNYDYDIKIASKVQKFRNDIIDQTAKKEKEDNYWTYDEFNLFLNYVDDDYYYLIFNFMYYTGVRFGEMAALTWNDFNENNKTVTISKSLSNKVGNGSYVITTPKTKNSYRTIRLDNELYNILLDHFNLEKNIYAFSKKMFIFGNTTHLAITTLRRKLKIFIKKVQKDQPNFKSITIHGFRHSHASLLIHLGLTAMDIADRFGDNPSMIENTYYHMFPSRKNETVNLLNSLKK